MKVPDGGTKVLKVDTFNSKDSNSIIRNYYQFGPGNIRQKVYLDICQQLMSEPLFDILRTKEQLGYHVASQCLNTDGILGMRVYVNSQATKFTVEHVDNRIEAFLEWFIKEKLEPLSDEEFNLAIMTLIKKKSQADVKLSDEFYRNWSEITTREYIFDRKQREIQMLKECDKNEMIEFVSKLLSKSNECRRKLSIQVVGSSLDGEEKSNINSDEEGDGEQFITDIVSFKSTLTAYPPHKIIE